MSRVTWPRALIMPFRTIQVKCSRGVMAGLRLNAARASRANCSGEADMFIFLNLAERPRGCKRSFARRPADDSRGRSRPLETREFPPGRHLVPCHTRHFVREV